MHEDGTGLNEIGSSVCITLDVDWAPDGVMEPVLDALRRAAVKATFFATHASPLLMAIDDPDVEVGLHPNFNDCGGDFEQRIRLLKEAYPAARGGRSHSLFVSSHILQLYRKYGLSYESNNFLPMHPHLRPVMRFPEFVSIPFYWSDDKLDVYSSFTLEDLGLATPGLKVLNFHPIHVFMNTTSEAHYLSYKQHYHDVAALRPLVNSSQPGVATLFHDVLEHLRRSGARTRTMREICDSFLQGRD